ncbi:MAG TPA: hypothetical protein VEY87_11055 [Gaiellaceae bacterium]|nr:hypothetical protein [Gaiellaceae bacterium]
MLGGLALALLVAAGATGSRAAATTPETKWFTTAVAPTPLAGSGSQRFAFTLTNYTSSKQTIGAANATLPETLPSPTVNPTPVFRNKNGALITKSWSVNYDAATRVIALRALDGPSNALAPGDSIAVNVTANVPCGFNQPISTDVKQSNKFLGDDNNFLLLPGSTPATIRTPGNGTASLAISPNPIGTREVNKDFSVTVTATDACGNPGTGSVALSLLPGENTGQLTVPYTDATGTTTRISPPGVTLSGGSATFPNLQIDASGSGYKLRATWNTLTRDTDGFDVVDKACDPRHVECTLADDTTELTTKSDRNSNGLMRLSFTRIPGCGAGRQLGSAIEIDPVGYGTNETIIVEQRWFKSTAPGTGVTNFTLCLGKPDPASPDAGLLMEVVPKCKKDGNFPSGYERKYCELQRSRDGVGALVISYKIYAEDPGAGLFG